MVLPILLVAPKITGPMALATQLSAARAEATKATGVFQGGTWLLQRRKELATLITLNGKPWP